MDEGISGMVNYNNMRIKRSWSEIKKSINNKRELMEQTNWSDPKYDDMYKRANGNFNDLEQYVYSVIATQPD